MTPEALRLLGKQACIDPENPELLAKEVSAILDFVQALQGVNTTHIPPMAHHLHAHAFAREDVALEENCLEALEQLAPLMEDSLYSVPRIIDTES